MNEESSAPTHIGYIVDGNRRWAKKHGLPPYEGHLAGFTSLKDVVLYTLEQPGVEFVSIYIFSTENWKRPEKEVATIMKLAMRIFKSELKDFIKRGVRIRVLGVEEGLTDELIDAAHKAEEATKDLTNGTICVCFNYGGQREIADAARKCVEDGLKPEEVTEQAIADRLYAPEVPPVDLVVRTSGEQRLSNFLLWRSAYSELTFLEKLWPDMRSEDVTAIIKEYKSRHRRYGK
jgi:undecaprenyl diphosphate synthase